MGVTLVDLVRRQKLGLRERGCFCWCFFYKAALLLLFVLFVLFVITASSPLRNLDIMPAERVIFNDGAHG